MYEWDELKPLKSGRGHYTVFAHFAEVAVPVPKRNGGHEVLLYDDARGLYLKIAPDTLYYSKDKKRAKKWARLSSGEYLALTRLGEQEEGGGRAWCMMPCKK